MISIDYIQKKLNFIILNVFMRLALQLVGYFSILLSDLYDAYYHLILEKISVIYNEIQYAKFTHNIGRMLSDSNSKFSTCEIRYHCCY